MLNCKKIKKKLHKSPEHTAIVGDGRGTCVGDGVLLSMMSRFN